MVFEVSGNVAKIDGSKGKYDNKVTNPSVRYGRNAVENYYTYLEQPLIADTMNTAPILDFGLSPDAPQKNADKLEKFLKENDEYLSALPPELDVKELDARFAPDKSFTSEALDVNKDGKIDIAEYSSSILAADMLSKADVPNPANIDVTINKKGFDAVLAYTQKSKAAAAAKLYSNIYNTYNLGEAQKEFNAG